MRTTLINSIVPREGILFHFQLHSFDRTINILSNSILPRQAIHDVHVTQWILTLIPTLCARVDLRILAISLHPDNGSDAPGSNLFVPTAFSLTATTS